MTLVHTSCAAPLSSDDESESESDESEGEADSDRTDIRYAWEHTLRTRWTEAPGHDGLTESAVLRALEGLDYKVYGGNPTLSELARMYHERFGQGRDSANVLGLMRDGILNMDRVLSELDDERRDVVDDRTFGLRLTRSLEEPRMRYSSRSAARSGARVPVAAGSAFSGSSSIYQVPTTQIPIFLPP